ncbi:O-antigen ligase family protein [Antarcticibacterium arcticum]|uniref:O-antigen ligase family protein n=1 Tax=Antarcticibacterium arcticum TaxID=2585771 RepID=A0A5B8YPC8_9FLAO|nr:O-antigen ligase family protein [Antarcticibacterium arcticum]QED37739.1 O-antigen ligase family protein [Antarcticibacterium arcticum]
MAAAYIAGAEVFFRMNGSMVFYETGKYAVIFFLIIGMFFKGTSTKTVPYWIYLLILIPGIIVASFTLDYDVVFRKAIAFNLSGPVSLGVSALYCYYKKITAVQFNYILMMLLMPLITTMAYLYFYTPSIGEVLMSGTNSNYAASGGYGPNQISTIMGLGAFILCTRLFVIKDSAINVVDFVLMGLMGYRAIVTFSRGGVITAIICILVFLLFYYIKQSRQERKKLFVKFTLLFAAICFIWIYTATKTQGLITYRYTNKNAAGQLETDITTGRAELIVTELQGFYNNPVMGIGVGKGKKFRSEEAGRDTASHNEISRLLSEHGLLGIVAVLILIFVPIIFWAKFKNNYYFLAFVAFWFLTVNHSAMRIALPGLVYGLALLYIVDEKKDPVYRKRLSN